MIINGMYYYYVNCFDDVEMYTDGVRWVRASPREIAIITPGRPDRYVLNDNDMWTIK